jgi:hypothetical protein
MALILEMIRTQQTLGKTAALAIFFLPSAERVARLDHEARHLTVGASSPLPSPPQVCGGEGEEPGGLP